MARHSTDLSRGVSSCASGSYLSGHAPDELAVVSSYAGQVGRKRRSGRASSAGQVGRQAPVTDRREATTAQLAGTWLRRPAGPAAGTWLGRPASPVRRQIHDQPRPACARRTRGVRTAPLPDGRRAAPRSRWRWPARARRGRGRGRPTGLARTGGPRRWRSGALGADPTCISCHSPRSSSALAFHTRVSCKACQGLAIVARLAGYAGPRGRQCTTAPEDASLSDLTAPTTARPPGLPAAR